MNEMSEKEIKFDEKWSKWLPIAEIEGRYDIHKILYNHDNFRLILKKQHHLLEITFPQTIAAIRIANESVIFKLYDCLFTKYGKDFYTDWSFFKVENSDCLKWLSSGTYGASELYDLTHYAISDLDQVIDVVTHQAPTIKMINNYNQDEPKRNLE